MKQVVKHGATIDAVTADELRDILRESATAEHVAFGGDSIEKQVRDWPVKNHDRKVRATKLQGDDNLALGAGQYVDLLPQDRGRGGVSIVNGGANPCILYLVIAQTAQEQQGKVAAVYLPVGGSWDGTISKQPWVGPVSARSAVGTFLVLAVI